MDIFASREVEYLSHHITSHHITSHHITSQYHNITSFQPVKISTPEEQQTLTAFGDETKGQDFQSCGIGKSLWAWAEKNRVRSCWNRLKIGMQSILRCLNMKPTSDLFSGYAILTKFLNLLRKSLQNFLSRFGFLAFYNCNRFRDAELSFEVVSCSNT